MIAYISSKNHRSKTSYPSNACQILIQDDDSPSRQDNIYKNFNVAIPNLAYDLEDDVKEVYLYNQMSRGSYPGFKCRYEVKVCKDNNYGNCVTFTGSLDNVKQTLKLKQTYPQYSSYFGNANSIKGTLSVVAPPKPKPVPKPVVVAPVPKPDRRGNSAYPVSGSSDVDEQLERGTLSKRKMRKSRKARKN